jgi:iron only hydrogenase large subunit-like protein
MPCYDKKLEASRSDFYNDVYSTRDVDCVITTAELELMMKEKGWDLSKPVPEEADVSPRHSSFPDSMSLEGDLEGMIPEMVIHEGSSSGSYLQSIIAHVMDSSAEPLILLRKQIRNADYEEYELRQATNTKEEGSRPGEVVFRGARCYGFRNLQNLVRKVGKEKGLRVATGAAGRLAGERRAGGVARRGRKEDHRTGASGSGPKGYDYVEVMACPAGCINGGGQLKPQVGAEVDAEGYSRDWEDSGVMLRDDKAGGDTVRWGNKAWSRKVELAYWMDTAPHHSRAGPQSDDSEEEAGNTVSARHESKNVEADRMMRLIIDNLCQSDEGLGDVSLCEERDLCRTRFLRTQYRAVQAETDGLNVQW